MQSLLDLVFPARCAGCGQSGHLACRQCHDALAGSPVLRWPTPCPPGLPAPYSVAAYDGPVRAMLLAYKDRDAVGLTATLADALRRSIDAAVASTAAVAPLLVVVPSTRASSRRRGYDPLARLARAAACPAGSRVLRGALVHARDVHDSASLSAEDRARNLAGALTVAPALRHRLSGQTVVLLDDVVTTGATLSECARALRVAGAIVPSAAVIAATRRRLAARDNW